MNRTLWLIPMAALLLMAAARRSAGQEFEVVSIRPSASGPGSSGTHADGGMLRATNNSLRQLIVTAYGLKDYQVDGPDWLSSARFDIVAKFPGDFPKESAKYTLAFESMMQKMLAGRFGLTVHREEKSSPVFGIVTAKGIRFKEVPDTGSHGSSTNNNHYSGHCVTMDKFASFVSLLTELPAVDMTGLKGCYDLTLDWVPEPKDGASLADAPAGPTLRDALEGQLGLKLENRKAPVELLVVDHVEKMPTEN